MIESNFRASVKGSILILTVSLLFFLLSILYLVKESVVDKKQTVSLLEEYYDSRIMEELFLQEYEPTFLDEQPGTVGKVNYSIGSIEYEIRSKVLVYRIYLKKSSKVELKKKVIDSTIDTGGLIQ